MQFLRGLENLLIDLATDPPELGRLVEVLLDYNLKVIGQWVQAGVDLLHFHGDIGTQRGLMMSPATFRRHIKPAYREMFGACRRAGIHVHYSCDGNLMEIVDDLIECGVSYTTRRWGACGIDGIAGRTRGSSARWSTSTSRRFRSAAPATSTGRCGRSSRRSPRPRQRIAQVEPRLVPHHGDYQAEPDMPMVTVIQPAGLDGELPRAKVTREKGLLAVTLPDGESCAFRKTDEGWGFVTKDVDRRVLPSKRKRNTEIPPTPRSPSARSSRSRRRSTANWTTLLGEVRPAVRLHADERQNHTKFPAEVRLGHDETNLYTAVKCEEKNLPA